MNRENESLESNVTKVTPSDVTYSLGYIIVESNSTVGKIHDLVVILISLVLDELGNTLLKMSHLLTCSIQSFNYVLLCLFTLQYNCMSSAYIA